MKFISFIFFLFLSLNCIAQPAWLEVTEQRVQVSDEVMQNWQENVFKSGKEFWTVGNFLKFHLFLNKIGLSLEQNSYIAKQMRQNTGDNHIETGDLFSFLNVPVDKSLRAYYFLDLEFLASLKIEQVQQIYQYMENTIGLRFFMMFSSKSEFQKWAKKSGLPKKDKDFLESLLVNFRGQILKLPITPYNWTKISEIDRANLINEQVFLNDQNLNLQLNIREREEIFEIAEAFSGSISSEDIAEYLLKKWETKSNIPLRVNALEILPPFMQYAYGNFSETGGPNCFNCAINSKRQSAFHVEYNDKEELKRHLSQYYRPMTEYEIPQVGDLIIYYKKNKSPIHAANYLPFDLAFSKNGINKFASYQIQDLDTLNATYKYSGNITAKYYRLKKPEILHLNIRQSQTSCSSSAFIE